MNELLIKIKSLWDGSGSKQAIDGVKALGKEIDDIGSKSQKTRSALAECIAKGSALGSAIGGGIFSFAEGALHMVESVIGKFKELVSTGMEFNRLMENSQIALAGAFRSVDPGLSFMEAKQKGGDAIDSLKEKALDLGVNFEALLDTFKVNVPTMWEAGIRDTQQMINLITLLNQVAAAKGIDGFQAQRDIIDLLNGQGNRTILGKELEANGVGTEQIKAAKEQGTLYDLLTTKLAAYGEAGRAAADTQTAAMNRLETAWNSLLGELSKPLFEELTKDYQELTKTLQSTEGKDALKSLGVEVRDLVHDGFLLVDWAIKNADSIAALAGTVGVLGSAFIGLKIAELVESFASMGSRLLVNTGLWAAETTAISANTAAKTANAAVSQQIGNEGFNWQAQKSRKMQEPTFNEGPIVEEVDPFARGGRFGAAPIPREEIPESMASVQRGTGAALKSVGSAASGALEAEAVEGAMVAGIAMPTVGAALTAVFAASLATALAVAAGSAFGKFIFDPFASLTSGKMTSGVDEEKMLEFDKNTDLSDFSKRASKLSTSEDQIKLLDDISDRYDALIKEQSSLKGASGFQKEALQQEIAGLQNLQKAVASITDARLHDNEVKKQISQDQQSATDAKDLDAAETAVKNDVERKGLSPRLQLRELEKEQADTHAWTIDPQREIEGNQDSGKKRDLELVKQRAELEKRIHDDDEKALLKSAESRNREYEVAKAQQEKKGELELELQINEARVAGNKPLLDKLQWTKDYQALVKSMPRLPDGSIDPNAYNVAIRGANADAALRDKPERPHLSSLASSGHSMGEQMSAAQNAPREQARSLAKLAATVSSHTAILHKVATATQKTADKRGGTFV